MIAASEAGPRPLTRALRSAFAGRRDRAPPPAGRAGKTLPARPACDVPSCPACPSAGLRPGAGRPAPAHRAHPDRHGHHHRAHHPGAGPQLPRLASSCTWCAGHLPANSENRVDEIWPVDDLAPTPVRAPCPPDPIRAFDLFRRARVAALDVTTAGNGADARRFSLAPGSRAPVSRSRALLGGKIYITRELQPGGPAGAPVASSLRCRPSVISVMYKPAQARELAAQNRKARARPPSARQPGAEPVFVPCRRRVSGAAQSAAPSGGPAGTLPACHGACMSRPGAACPT